MRLTLAEARAMFDGAAAKAAELGRPMAISIVDAGGRVVLSGRMDGVPWATIQVTETMAESAVAFGIPGAALKPYNDQPWVAAATLFGGRRVIGLDGALLAYKAGELVGAIACGGGTGEEDRLCATAGLAAASLRPTP